MNATQRALLKGIAAAPHDDAPRLVYADWLDEYAAELPKKEREATAARAEIIRVQCELARLAEEDCDSRWVYEYLNAHSLYDAENVEFRVDWSELDPGLARRLSLKVRDLRLSSAYGDGWRKNEVPAIEGLSFYMNRGFWTDVTLSSHGGSLRDILKVIRQQTDLVPLRSLYCERELTAQESEQLVRSKWLAHLSVISGGLDRPLFTALGQSPIAAGIKESFLQLADDSIALPFNRKGWSGLREFQVMMHGEEGHLTSLKSLVRAKHLAKLQTISIDLDGWAWLDTAHALAGGVWQNLHRLNYEAFSVGLHQAKSLAKGRALKELRYLLLGRSLDGDGATVVLKSPTFKNLVVVVLRGDDLGGLDGASLRNAKRPNLRVLDLPVASRADLLALAKSPITQNLHILQLGSDITDGAMKAFFSAMRMPQLTVLNLSHNQNLGPTTAATVGTCDRLRNLQSLNLMWTKIGDAGAKALAQSKHLGKLRHLDVTNAGVTASGVAALRKRFGDEAVRA
jgi:uncharacterized protein (TIGR02996 family)